MGFRLDDFWTVIQRTKNGHSNWCPVLLQRHDFVSSTSTRHRLLARRKTHAPRLGNLIAANRALD